MKKSAIKLNLLTLFIITNFWSLKENILFSQGNCLIQTVSAEVTTCEDSIFDVSINFEYEYTSDSFRIQGNGVNYGNFAYNDVPITLTGLGADCETNYEFIVIDIENDGCSDYTELGSVCCGGNCALSELSLTPGDCNDDYQHTLTIDFNYENPGNDYFDLWVNGDFISYYALANLPVTVTLSGTNNKLDQVLVCINDNDNCCIDGNSENTCYNTDNDCKIWDVTAKVTTCEDSIFDISINFEYEYTSDSFRIQGNGVNYGNFAYDDIPITLTGLGADCETNYEFIVIDIENDGCSDYTELGSVCCEPSSTSDKKIEDIDIISVRRGIIIDFNDNLFDRANILMVNSFGQKIAYKSISKNTQRNKYLISFDYNGVIFVKISLKNNIKESTISKKFVGIID